MRITSQKDPVPVLLAFLNAPLPQATMDKIHADFGAAPFNHAVSPEVRLEIREEPRFYNKGAEEIRTVLDLESPDLETFLLIESDVAATGAVWYVRSWAEEDEAEFVVQHGDERVLWKLRVMVKAVPSRWVDYSVPNSSIMEDFYQNSTAERYDPHAQQTPYQIDDTLDEFIPLAYIVAGPGEWEEGDGALLNVMPRQEKVYRLEAEVAQQHGLCSNWAVGWLPDPLDEEEEGSMCFSQNYDVTFTGENM